MTNLLKELINGINEATPPIENKFDAQEIHDKLQAAADDEEIETITFGLETDDGKIVKVYVAAEDADAFEEALSQKLGEEDDIEDLLDELSQEFDIVDVEWPEDDDVDDSDKDGDGIDDNDESLPDGSDALNKNVDYDDYVQQYFSGGEGVETDDLLDNVLSEDVALSASTLMMDPEAKDVFLDYAKDKNQQLGLAIMMLLGLPPSALDRVIRTNRSIMMDIRMAVRALGSANRHKLAQMFDITDETFKSDNNPGQ